MIPLRKYTTMRILGRLAIRPIWCALRGQRTSLNTTNRFPVLHQLLVKLHCMAKARIYLKIAF